MMHAADHAETRHEIGRGEIHLAQALGGDRQRPARGIQRTVGVTLEQPLPRRFLEAVAKTEFLGQVAPELDTDPGPDPVRRLDAEGWRYPQPQHQFPVRCRHIRTSGDSAERHGHYRAEYHHPPAPSCATPSFLSFSVSRRPWRPTEYVHLPKKADIRKPLVRGARSLRSGSDRGGSP